ncbi:hypothetical protein [Clostridium sp. YIM B02500]|uniref:hypothetical protein n=1 Tax=Clostridium sp. YIM B02500 TaxID=2910681 RepID=UPI001EED6759|nr:hypothetical protein [Clostridium sp. YIM B02500]
MEVKGLIDVNLIDEEIIPIDEYKKKYSDWLLNSNLLREKSMSYNSEATFESNVWIFFSDIQRQHLNFNFKLLDDLIKFKLMENDDVILFKCFLTKCLMSDDALYTVKAKFKTIISFILLSNNFNKDMINNKKGNIFYTFFKNKENIQGYLFQYLDFLDVIRAARDEHYIVLGLTNGTRSNRDNNRRVLPCNKDIIAFDYYLKKFFSEEDNKNLKNYFMPILLWWKITNVLPLRSSEFANQLKRDCLVEEDGKYYLRINRIKVARTKRLDRNDAKIPLLKKIRVSKQINDLILEYLQIIDFDNDSDTLLSYKACVYFRNEYYKSLRGNKNLAITRNSNLLKDSFSSNLLEGILNNFYQMIIRDKYFDTSIKDKISLGDTRHLAFCSLLLQGISPIEIAMLGGHTTLLSQNHYIGHTSYYIDNEIVNYFSNNMLNNSKSDKELKYIIFNKTILPQGEIKDDRLTEDKVGYCMMDFNNDDICDDVLSCIYCSKWWCEPTNESYIKIKKYIENSCISPLEKSIKEEEKFLERLLRQAKVINVNGILEIEQNGNKKIKQSILNIRNDADKVILFKKSLFERYGEFEDVSKEGYIWQEEKEK